MTAAIDRWFPELGPCGICGTGLDQRHRVLDAICDRVSAGEAEEDVAADYGLPSEAIYAAVSGWDASNGKPRTAGHPVSDAMIERAWDVLSEAGAMPHKVWARDYVSEGSTGEQREREIAALQAADAEADRLNREMIRRALEAALGTGGEQS